MRMKRRNPVGASQNRAEKIGRPAKLGYGAKLNAVKEQKGAYSPHSQLLSDRISIGVAIKASFYFSKPCRLCGWRISVLGQHGLDINYSRETCGLRTHLGEEWEM